MRWFISIRYLLTHLRQSLVCVAGVTISVTMFIAMTALMYGLTDKFIVETVDTSGHPRSVKLVRGPSHAPDVSVAVVEMIKRAGPLPAPSRFAGPVSFTEIWLVHKDGRFQLDALTEGQD